METTTQVSLAQWAKKVHTAFGAPAMLAIPFALAAGNARFVRQSTEGHPVLFLCGEPATGKTALTRAMALATDAERVHLALNTGQTYTAMNRAFSASEGALVVLEEYQNGKRWLDERLRAAWSGTPYQSGPMGDGLVVEHTALAGSLVVTSTSYPRDTILLQRLLVIEMPQPSMTEESKAAFAELHAMTKGMIDPTDWLHPVNGIPFDAPQNYLEEARVILYEHPFGGKLSLTMCQRFSKLLAAHLFCAGRIPLPYSTTDVLDYLRLCITRQNNKMHL